MTINIEELMSNSEEENNEEEEEWRPEKPEKGRRVSKKPKATGVRKGVRKSCKLVKSLFKGRLVMNLHKCITLTLL